jgi:hypothetical protein
VITMSIETAVRPVRGFKIPSPAGVGRLFAGGLAGLLAWEIWSRTVTTRVLGYPLPPPELVISLARAWAGYELPYPAAVAVHYTLGIVGYPVLYYLISRGVRTGRSLSTRSSGVRSASTSPMPRRPARRRPGCWSSG